MSRNPIVAVDASPCAGARTGVGRYVEDLAEGLHALGQPPALVYQGHHGPLFPPVATHATACRRYDLLGGRVGAWLRLPHVLRSLGADVYHSTSTIAVPGPGWRGKVVATVMDCYPLTPGAQVTARHRRLFRQLLGAILRRADVIIAPSRFSADELRGLGHSGHIEVIPLGLRPPTPGPRPTSAPPGGYLLTLGAIEYRKGLHLLAAAKPSLPWIHCGPLRCDPDGSIIAAMDAAGCRRLGFVSEEERLSWLTHATLLAMPSQTEGFGYPPLEAMALGVPVIAFPNGSLPEVLGDAAVWTGPERLGDDLRHLLGDPTALSRCRAEGPLRAKAFDPHLMASRHHELYHGCTA
jgi:glycosyltransferase involved in cell wall biosynthesis